MAEEEQKSAQGVGDEQQNQQNHTMNNIVSPQRGNLGQNNDVQSDDDQDLIIENNNDGITTHNNRNNNNNSNLVEASRLLYVSQFFSQFSEWIWQFGTVIWLAKLSNFSSLFLNSAYQATTNLLVLVLVPRLLSRFVDDTSRAWNRSHFAFYLITTQSICIGFASILFDWTLSNGSDDDMSPVNDNLYKRDLSVSSNQSDNDSLGISTVMLFSLIAICILGGLAQVLNKSFLVALERDWIVVMADSDEVWLCQTNVALKQIYIGCQIFGPVLTGYVLSNDGDGGVVWFGTLKTLSLFIEYVCMKRVYSILPTLQTHSGRSSSSDAVLRRDDVDTYQNAGISSFHPAAEENDATAPISAFGHCQKDLRVYFQQTMAWAGLGLALLYCNILHLGGMMNAYLASCGMSLTAIGIWQGISNVVGLLGTFLFSLSQKYRMSLEVSALWSILWEFVFLTISVVGSIALTNNPTLSANLIIAGVLPSRIGLWVYDISVTQLFQQTVPIAVRGRVGGTQTSLNAFFEFVPFIFGMIYSDVQDFWILMVGGYASVGIAMSLYFVGIYVPYKNNMDYTTIQEW